MELRERLQTIATRVSDINLLVTEEATKNALVMPFIQALGYDVFDPSEVVPEYTADIGTKRGEKVDYAIVSGDQILMLFEAKRASANLGDAHSSQLFRYFTATQGRIGVLTNGLVYKFYSDIDEANKMDRHPFLVIDLQALRDDSIAELQQLTKENFDLEGVLAAASDLKQMRTVKGILERQFDEPEEDFLKFLFQEANPGKRFVQSAAESFREIVKAVIAQMIRDRVNARLRSALQEGDSAAGDSSPPPTEEPEATVKEKEGVVTTEEELEGFSIVKAIVCEILPLERIGYRDTKTYFGVLCDDNNRRPICRLHFNSRTKYVGLFDAEKNETRHKLETLRDLYQHRQALLDTARRYVADEESAG